MFEGEIVNADDYRARTKWRSRKLNVQYVNGILTQFCA